MANFNYTNSEREIFFKKQIGAMQNEKFKKEIKNDKTNKKFGDINALNEYCEKLYNIMTQEVNLFTGPTTEEQSEWRVREITKLNDEYVQTGKLTSYDLAVANDMVREEYRETNPGKDLEFYNSMTAANQAYSFIITGKENALLQYQGAGKTFETDKALAQTVENFVKNDVTPTSEEQVALVYNTIVNAGYSIRLSNDQRKQPRYKKATGPVMRKIQAFGHFIGKHSKKLAAIFATAAVALTTVCIVQNCNGNGAESSYAQAVQIGDNLSQEVDKAEKKEQSPIVKVEDKQEIAENNEDNTLAEEQSNENTQDQTGDLAEDNENGTTEKETENINGSETSEVENEEDNTITEDQSNENTQDQTGDLVEDNENETSEKETENINGLETSEVENEEVETNLEETEEKIIDIQNKNTTQGEVVIESNVNVTGDNTTEKEDSANTINENVQADGFINGADAPIPVAGKNGKTYAYMTVTQENSQEKNGKTNQTRIEDAPIIVRSDGTISVEDESNNSLGF